MPNNWKKYKLGELTEKITKGTTPSTVGGKFLPSGVNYIKSEAVGYDGRIDRSTFVYIDEVTHEKLKRSQLEEGDILFSMAGAFLGKTGMVSADMLPANTNQANAIIRLKKNEVNPNFVHYFLRMPETVRYVNSMSSQSAQPNINLEEIGSLEINLPPLPEQEAIAEILSSLDDKIELNLQTNKTLEEMANALYKHWFVDFGPFKEGKFVESELGMIPEGWEVVKIGDYVETLGGGTPSTTNEEYWANGDINWYSPTDLTKQKSLFSYYTEKKITDLGLLKSSARLFPSYSLLMSSRATIGLITINTKEACSNQGFITLIPNKAFSLFQLHGWLLQNMELIISKANGSTFKEISKSNFRELKILKAKNLDSYITNAKEIFNLIENNIEMNNSLKQTRDYILPKLISGEIRVKEAKIKVKELL
jgi:type I restriction enzyme S subunit